MTRVKRTQRSRRGGYQQPPNTRYCGRGTIYGNPFTMKGRTADTAVALYKMWLEEDIAPEKLTLILLHQGVGLEYVDGTVRRLQRQRQRVLWDEGSLAEYEHLSCWCRLEDPCHVDVLLGRVKARQAKRATTTEGSDDARAKDRKDEGRADQPAGVGGRPNPA